MIKESNDIRYRFGQQIKKLRKRKGLSQEAFADVCNIHRTYAGDIERGERNISLINIEKIAKGLNVSLAELFNFSS